MKKLYFVDRDATVRAPMAAAILKDMVSDSAYQIEARGVIVLFPEPLNQKTEAVLASNGIRIENYSSKQLAASDVDEETVILLIDAADAPLVLDIIGSAHANKCYVLNEVCGEELGVMDPYGGVLGSYGICYETLTITLKKLVARLKEGFPENKDTEEKDA